MEEITEVSGGVDSCSSRPQTVFRRHQWPVTLRHGPVELAPIRIRDRAVCDRVRAANVTWLRPWEATLPPHSGLGPASYAGLVRTLTKRAKGGRTLPWLVFYDRGEGGKRQLVGQLTVSGIVGGSA